MTVLRAGAATDVGRVRTGNEDRYLVADNLFAVADGLGGHRAGEVASSTAADTLRNSFHEPHSLPFCECPDRRTAPDFSVAPGNRNRPPRRNELRDRAPQQSERTKRNNVGV